MKIERKYRPDSSSGFTLAELSDMIEDALRAGVPSSARVRMQWVGALGPVFGGPTALIVDQPIGVSTVDPLDLQVKIDGQGITTGLVAEAKRQSDALRAEEARAAEAVGDDRPDDWGA